MFKLRWLAVAFFVLSIVGWLGYTVVQDQQLAQQRLRLSKPQSATNSQGRTKDGNGDPAPKADLDQLASVGMGMPLPNDLVVAKIDPEDYWFVGKFENGPGVEIPFPPGRLPTPPAKLEPLHANPGFVGPDACQECHEDIYNSFVHTGHYLTCQPVNPQTIDGQFTAGKNRFNTSDPHVSFEMIEREDQFLQRTHFYDWQFDVPMQIIMGSSKMAQTYLYWHADRLYQCNVTHITDGDQWINSPGYIDGDAAYARPVPERCMDCHATYFDFRAPPNHYTPDSLILGVTCERCHGPGEQHVDYHQQNPEATQAHAIIMSGSLSRQQQLEVCGQCHGGSRSLKGPALRYRPGDSLADFYHPPIEDSDAANTVHASNQLTRLAESTCFQQTEMTCSDCHNPHQNERNDIRLASSRCLSCHQTESCEMHSRVDFDLAANCIDCHMPIRPTEKLRLKSIEGDVFPPLRDHFIRVDKQATKEFLETR